MKDTIAGELTQLGLNPTEAQIYLTLIQNGPMGASAVAAATGLARTSVYPALGSLVDKGLVNAGEGYASRFSAIPAERALPHLMETDKESLLHRERLTAEVVDRIASLADETDRTGTAPEEVIQVIRSPRAVVECVERLTLEAERQIDVFTKPPFFLSAANRSSNPTQEKAQRRGVRCRSLYEKAALEDAGIKPYLAKWIAAGEEARIYDGELPHKLAIFDSQVVLLPLFGPGEQIKTVVVRHTQLAQSLSLAFQYVWDRSEPVARTPVKKVSGKQSDKIDSATQRTSRNGRRGRPAQVKPQV